MGFWARQVTPRLVAGAENEALVELRTRACHGLHGEVVELGFGSGNNLGLYPAGVTRVIAIEPSDVGWRLGAQRRAASPTPVVRGGLDGQRLDVDDDSADAVLSTFTLCTIPDAAAALAEVHRVLHPGGTLHFLEHGLAPDAGVATWQRRLEPAQRRVFAGCHLTRDVPALVAAAGLEVVELDQRYLPGPRVGRPWAYGSLGVARRPREAA
jgi:SAM-dependent methyltransferase